MENNQNQKLTFKKRFFGIIPPLTFIGILLGAIGGYIYYIEIGCASGTCPLTSNPYMSILWGAVMGYLLGDMFKKKKPVATDTEK